MANRQESDHDTPAPILRGDVHWVDFENGRGVEQRGIRPAVVVQNNRGNQYAPYTVVVPISSAPLSRAFPFTVLLEAGEANLARAGHINCAHTLTIDQQRVGTKIGELGDERMREVDAALRYELDL